MSTNLSKEAAEKIIKHMGDLPNGHYVRRHVHRDSTFDRDQIIKVTGIFESNVSGPIAQVEWMQDGITTSRQGMLYPEQILEPHHLLFRLGDYRQLVTSGKLPRDPVPGVHEEIMAFQE